jgi:hypothetical protein
MKLLIGIFLMFCMKSWATFSAMPTSSRCPAQMMQIWSQSSGYQCVPRFPQAAMPVAQHICPVTGIPFGPFSNFPSPLYQPQPMPWWGHQGNLHFPNMHYPGAWNFPGMQAAYYPGQGQVFAAKPNVYIESVHENKKFEFQFTSQEMLSFLATTPPLERKTNLWRGKIHKDKFEIDDVNYDYLFYDIRLPKEKMQFVNGICATREDTILWMLEDLKALKHPAISLQDFEEHWRVKIPDYPFYCIYPQYNAVLDAALPVKISLEQTRFIRSLYVLVPHKKQPEWSDPQEVVPYPTVEPTEIRPEVIITRENMFKEWGVAFLGFE